MVARKARTQKQRKDASTAPSPAGGASVHPAGGATGAPPVQPMGTPDPPLITEEYQRRLDEGREKALKDGRVMFRPPFGYKVVDGKLVVDEEKRALIVKILKDIDGGWKTRDIVSQNGVVAALVRRIRNNPIYRTGEVRYAGEVVFKVEPILPKGGKQ